MGRAEKNREENRRKLWSLLGELPQTGPVSSEKISEEPREGYILENLILDLNGFEPVPALFVKPLEPSLPMPAVFYSHVHGGEYKMGKRELVKGWRGLQDPPYAVELTRRGMAALCIDAWNFGERHNRTESSLFKEFLWNGRVLWGMMIYDAIRALDYLVSRPDVNGDRIAALGMSMGSTTSWWIAALDERISVCVDICCLTDFDALVEEKGLDLHGLYYFVPGLLKHFSAAEINALIAPRPHLALAGKRDPLTPSHGLEKIDRALKDVYGREGAPDAWRLEVENEAHTETPAMRNATLEWLQRWL